MQAENTRNLMTQNKQLNKIKRTNRMHNVYLVNLQLQDATT